MPEPVTIRTPFRAYGTGWRFEPPQVPVYLTFDLLAERRDEVTAELHIQTLDGGFLARRRLNLLGSRSHVDLAKELADCDGGAGWPWRQIIAEGCESTLNAYRAGSPTETIEGELKRPAPVTWQCDRLVMANVTNCWLAAASTGKSTFAKLYCLAHAAGLPFLGRMTARGVPLYLDYEDTRESYEEVVYLAARGLEMAAMPKMHWRRGKGPLRSDAQRLAAEITRLGVTLLVIDPVAAAGGPLGERGYEAVAMEVEQALLVLPPVTVLLLDHVTGDELKNGAVAIKARGSARKYEFVRYQWSLSLDRDEAERGRHIVGWTHSKVNRGAYQPAFGVEVQHRDLEGKLDLNVIKAGEVAPLADRQNLRGRIESALDRLIKASVKDIAEHVYGSTTRNRVEACRVLLKRYPRSFAQAADGEWVRVEPKTQTARPPDCLPEAEDEWAL